MATFDRAGIAERLRGLLSGQDSGDLAQTAARLGLEEVSLRMSIDDLAPHPTVEVLAAVIWEYGVDPSWLLTGTYDMSTHRTSIESNAGAAAALRDFVDLPPRLAEPPPESVPRYNQA